MSKGFSKKIREAVHRKCGGHCAYCGREITMRQMQVDHAKPQNAMRRVGWTTDGKIIYEDIHHLDNLLPSCRYCNNYKGSNGIEGLRLAIKNLASSHQLMFASHSKGMVLQAFGIITVHQWDGLFYFEKQSKPNKHENLSEIPYQEQEG